MQRWVAAYNRRDERTFLAYLYDSQGYAIRTPPGAQDKFVRLLYRDCDYKAHSYHTLEDRSAVALWIRRMWALNDHLELRDITDFTRQQGRSLPGRYLALDLRRTNNQLSRARNLIMKFAVVRIGDNRGLIAGAGWEDWLQCESGTIR